MSTLSIPAFWAVFIWIFIVHYCPPRFHRIIPVLYLTTVVSFLYYFCTLHFFLELWTECFVESHIWRDWYKTTLNQWYLRYTTVLKIATHCKLSIHYSHFIIKNHNWNKYCFQSRKYFDRVERQTKAFRSFGVEWQISRAQDTSTID